MRSILRKKGEFLGHKQSVLGIELG